MIKSILTAILFYFLSVSVCAQEGVEAVQKKSVEDRLIELENHQRDFEQWYSEFYLQSKQRVSPFLGEKISLGGFFETAITHLGGPDFSSQTSAKTNILGINLAAEFNERIRFVTQYITVLGYTLTNPNNNPGLAPTERQFGTPTFGSLVAQAYVEYRKSELLVFQTGIDGFTDAYYGWIRSYCKIT